MGVISFYFESDQPIEKYLDQLAAVVSSMGSRYVVVGGDANAWNTWWGSKKTDSRGETLFGVLELDLQILNQGSTPTLDTIRRNKRYSSRGDITACSLNALLLVSDWRVDDSVTSSDHNAIVLCINLKKERPMIISGTTRKFCVLHKAHPVAKRKFHRKRIYRRTRQYRLIAKACEASMPIRKITVRYSLPWWNDAPIRSDRVIEEYLEAKELYESLAKTTQIASWKAFCEQQDKEGLWDGICRVIG
ncbi:uncharacterized protein LOC112045826 [Bicyclus anynana]|uniref:Uncharacterized protein LOC112045826 n=1 Tax=Bicyclus anynana TaxID=110368 RepID=A0A6J1MTT4_BICAN|nr:uncharacterized protein LOC112045826 [Bicyclus anynana]